MEPFPTLPSNKRHAMHFRRRTPSDNSTTLRLPNSKPVQCSPSNDAKSTYRTPASIDEALDLSRSLSQAETPSSSTKWKTSIANQTPLVRSQSSSWWMEIRKSPAPKQQPRSRKTTDATIRTDATETQPAFESDAFAIHMPTTREPILDTPVLRAKLSSPSKAQVDAYQTYKRKAHEVRERNYQEGVRVPSQIVSYDYAHAKTTPDHQALALEITPPSSPRALAPAGSFPSSPPVPRQGWAKPFRQHQVPRSTSDGTHDIPRKPLGLGNVQSNSSKIRHNQRADADTGAAHSLSPPNPSPIKVRIKPKVPHTERVQKESLLSLYNHAPQSSSSRSRSPSPIKDPFIYRPRYDGTQEYNNDDMTGAVAGASLFTTPPKASKPAPKSPSRWAWLKDASLKISKPATASKTPGPAVVKAQPYMDPFVLHASPVNTPTASRPASLKKLQRRPAETGKYESGFAQIKNVTTLLLKVCLFIYLAVGIYFLLDAIRQAVNAMGAPFRAVKLVVGYVWVGGAWIGQVLIRAWQRWGLKVAWRKGWRGWW